MKRRAHGIAKMTKRTLLDDLNDMRRDRGPS